MRIAIISDLHANYKALSSALEEIKQLGIDSIYCLGDFVGYFQDVNEVIAKAQENNFLSILGNHDNSILIDKPALNNKLGIDSFNLTRKLISKESRNFLKTLPLNLNLNFDGLNILMVHGSPWDNLSEYIYPEKIDIARFAALKNYDYIFMGHTHIPMIIKIGTLTLANPGSIGQPRAKIPLRSFIVFDTSIPQLHLEYLTDGKDVK